MRMTLAAAVRTMPWTVIALLAVITLMSCSSARIEVEGGTGLIGPRRVKVGEDFTVRQPFDRSTGAEWKIGVYDRTLLQPVPRFAYETAADGSMTRVYEFKAMSPGLAELEFLRRNREPITPGEPPPEREKKVIKVRIVE